MTFGLLGYPISKSFSRPYFAEKFEQLGIQHTHSYLNFELQNINEIHAVLDKHQDLRGFNVTIPYKREILALLDEIDATAAAIGAVNTVLVNNGKLKGFNTDIIGFREDFKDFIDYRSSQQNSKDRENGQAKINIKEKALVLGTGGASLAVIAALDQLNIGTTLVSRRAGNDCISYEQLNAIVLAEHKYVINCTPLGAAYEIDQCPNIPYSYLTKQHYCYDLVYNPAETLFMQKAKHYNAHTRNGMGMLIGQAEAAWNIWTKA